MGGDALIDGVEIGTVWETDVDVCVLEPESGIDVRSDLVVGLDNVLDVGIDKVVERVDVLFDEAFYFEESRQQEPFVLLDGRSKDEVDEM